jgi:hypothetical protein
MTILGWSALAFVTTLFFVERWDARRWQRFAMEYRSQRDALAGKLAEVARDKEKA